MLPAHGLARSASLLGTERTFCAAPCAMLCEAQAGGYYQSAVVERSALASPAMLTDSGPGGKHMGHGKASALRGTALSPSAFS